MINHRPCAYFLVVLVHGLALPPGVAGQDISSITADDTTLSPAVDFTSSASLISLRQRYGDGVDLALYAGLNSIAPGLGLVADGHKPLGVAYGAAGLSLLACALIADAQPNGESFRNNCLLLYQNLGLLSAWDGYYRGLTKRVNDVEDLILDRPGTSAYLSSPFDTSTILSWEWMVPTAAALALGTTLLVTEENADAPPPSDAVAAEWLILAQNVLVGTGEELMFRGVVLPELTSWVGTTRNALLVQALGFGLLHVSPDFSPEDNAVRFAFATTFGLYTGWVSLKRPDGLRKAISIHAWWNTIIFSADYLHDGVAEPIIVRIAF